MTKVKVRTNKQRVITAECDPSSSLQVQDNGVDSGAATVDTLNFDGSVTVSRVGNVVTITITGGGGGSGTVTSFSSGNLSPLFTTSVATATTTPALTFALSSQNANVVFAGPGTGIAAAPTFRSLVSADIPDISATYLTPAAGNSAYWKLTGTTTVTSPTISGIVTFASGLLITGGQSIDAVATGGSDVLNIGTSNADVINIGYAGSTVNIQGTLAYQNVTNLQVTDKLITLNKGGGVASGVSSGFEIEENAVITGWFTTDGTRNGFEFKAPAEASKATVLLSSLTADRSYTFPDISGTFLLSGATNILSGNTSIQGLNQTFEFNMVEDDGNFYSFDILINNTDVSQSGRFKLEAYQLSWLVNGLFKALQIEPLSGDYHLADDTHAQMNNGISWSANSFKLFSPTFRVDYSLLGGTTFSFDIGNDATGNTYYRDSSGNIAKLVIGAIGTALVSDGTLPTWGAIGVAGGGTGVDTITAGSILVSNSTDTLTELTPTALQSVRKNAGNTAWEAYTPAAGVSDANYGDITVASSGTVWTVNANINKTWTGLHIFTTAVTTGTGATSGHQITANSLTTGNGLDVSTTSLTTGNLVAMTSTSTAANGAQTVLNVTTSGANVNSGQSTYAAKFTNSHTGTTSTNYGILVNVTGSTTLYVARFEAIGNQEGMIYFTNTNNSAGANSSFYFGSGHATFHGHISANSDNNVTYGGVGSFNVFAGGSSLLALGSNDVTRLTFSTPGGNVVSTQSAQATTNTFWTFTQSVHTGGSPVGILYTGGAHTTLATGAEVTDINFNASATATIAGSTTLALNRTFRFQARTYTAASATTWTEAATVEINGAPTGGGAGPLTITRAFALKIAAGNVQIVGNTYHGAAAVAPTAFVHIAAGVTGTAQIRLEPGVAPSAPNNGDVYYINTADRLMFFKNATACEIVSASAVTTEVVVSDTTLSITFNGVAYKLLARA